MRYFQYISQPKVTMLRPQVSSPRAKLKSIKPEVKVPGMSVGLEFTAEEDVERNSLIRGVEEVYKWLESSGGLAPLESESGLSIGPWYRDVATWHAGVVAFKGGMSFSEGTGVATYLLWRMHRGALLVLVGSPRNLLSELQVAKNLFFQGSSGALMEIDRLFAALRTDETSALLLTDSNRKRDPWAGAPGVLWEGEAYIDESSALTALPRKSSSLTVPYEMSWASDGGFRIGAICFDFLEGLPESRVEVVFRFFSKHKIEGNPNSKLASLMERYERGLARDNRWRRRSRLRKKEFTPIYVGSPLFTALV